MNACRYCGREGKFYRQEPVSTSDWIRWAASLVKSHHQEACSTCGAATVWKRGTTHTLILPGESADLARLVGKQKGLLKQLGNAEGWVEYHDRLLAEHGAQREALTRVRRVLRGIEETGVESEVYLCLGLIQDALSLKGAEKTAIAALALVSNAEVAIKLVRQGLLDPDDALAMVVWPSAAMEAAELRAS